VNKNSNQIIINQEATHSKEFGFNGSYSKEANFQEENNQDNNFVASFFEKFINIANLELGEDVVNKWLINLEICSISNCEVIFYAPSKLVRDWVIREFIEVKKPNPSLKSIAQKVNAKIKKVSVMFVAKRKSSHKTINGNDSLNFQPQTHLQKQDQAISQNCEGQIKDKNFMQNLPNNFANSLQINNSQGNIVSISKYGNVFSLSTDLNPRFNFANFVAGKYNRLALSMAKIVAGCDNQPKLFEDNIPLFIHGQVGMGKTHLAQAIAWQIKENSPSKRVVYLSAEKFMFHFVQSIKSNELISFKEKMRLIDVLIVDDLQFIAGKQSTQQEFINSFNSMVEDNKQVVLVCDRHPLDLENIDSKLKSRITAGMVINFQKIDYQDRLLILNQKAQQLEEKIPSFIIELFAKNIDSNVRDLEGALKKLVAQKVVLNQEISLELAYSILEDYQPNISKNLIANQESIANFNLYNSSSAIKVKTKNLAKNQISITAKKPSRAKNATKLAKLPKSKLQNNLNQTNSQPNIVQSNQIINQISQQNFALLSFINPFLAEKIVDINQIKVVICQFYNIPMLQFNSKSKKSSIVFAKKIAIYLALNVAKFNLEEVATQFDKSSTCVKNACKMVQDLVNQSADFRTILQNICQIFAK